MRWMFSAIQSWKPDNEVIISLLMAVLMLFLLPLRWLGASLIAAALHEVGHYIAVFLLGGSIHHLKMRACGAVMEVSGLKPPTELICLLAGPFAGLLPMLIFRQIPVIAICGAIHSVFNLLPIYPLDGGRILKHIILMMGGTDRLYHSIENCIFILIFLTCVYLGFRFSLSLLLLPTLLIFRKTPCKQK